MLIFIAYLWLPNARPDLTHFNANDSESYLALSYAMTHGLGYTRSLVPGLFLPHTTWPPGLSLLLAPLTAVMGLPMNWLILKVYMIAIGMIGIGLAWIYLRRVSGSRLVADAGALVLACAPFYWFFSRAVMTEAPTVVSVIAALLAMDHAWASKRPRLSTVLAVGAGSGLAMLLRGTVVGLILVPLAYVAGPRRTLIEPKRMLWLLLAHALAFCIPFAVWAARGALIDKAGLGFDGIDQIHMLLSVSPTDQVSRLQTIHEIIRTMVANAAYGEIYHVPEQILPFLWNVHWQGWSGAPILAVTLTIIIFALAVPRQMISFPLCPVIVANMLILAPYAFGASSRFWMPITCLLILLLVLNCQPMLARMTKRQGRWLLTAIAAVMIPNLAVFAIRSDAHPYLGDLGDMVGLFDAAQTVRNPPGSVYTPHEMLFTLRTGLMAPMTVPARGLLPLYTHVVVHARRGPGDDGAPTTAPPGSHRVLARGDWLLMALPSPMPAAELTARSKP